MLQVFTGNTAEDVWRKAAAEFIAGVPTLEETRDGPAYEILHAGFTITNPQQRWVACREPPMNPAFAIAEFLWILAGRADSRFPNFWNPILPRFAGLGPAYHGAYGYRLRHSFGVDQLLSAYEALAGNPTSRQIVLQLYHPALDLPQEKGLPTSPDVPCSTSALLKVRDGKLHWTQIMRSNDLFRGTPHNFVQWTSIQEVLAGWLGLELGHYNHISDSLHVYERDCESLRTVRAPSAEPNNDSLLLPKEQSDEIFADLIHRAELLTELESSELALKNLVMDCQLPMPYRNLLCVLAADSLRRHGHWRSAQNVMEGCTNPALCQLWDRWLQRCRSRSK